MSKAQVEILNNSNVDADEIFLDYFNYKPPFEDNDKKRKEFPDAFIAAQIKAYFNQDKLLAIVSKDKGFIEACGKVKNYNYFNSLGELYDKLNSEEDIYHSTVRTIKDLDKKIKEKIENEITDKNNIIVNGIYCDSDGICEGYDYNEYFADSVSVLSVKVHSIDSIKENMVLATLSILAKIVVECSYDDYDNAIWDSEDKTYFGLDSRTIIESHEVRFAISIELNLETKTFQIVPFLVIMGENSLKERK